MSLESIRALVKEDLESTNQFIITQLESSIPLIHEMLEYLLSCGGKRIRPIVLLLSARALNHVGNKHIDLAAVIELTHTASLLHDDVVDKSTLRRGHKTANLIWGNDASILVGDFLYSRAFQILVGFKNQALLSIFAEGTHEITEGEILQLTNCHHPNTTELFYFDIIRRKTAKLFEMAAELGAVISSNADSERKALRDFGLHLGLAFQLIDDALDYDQSAKETGKNLGQDLSEGKVTLPLIHALRHGSVTEIKLLRKAIETGSSSKLETILGIIESTGAIQYTLDAAEKQARLAKLALSSIANSPYREALMYLTDFAVERTY